MPAPERMSLRKFWCRTFGGGIGAQFDWLAISMTRGFDEQAYAGTPERDGQQRAAVPECLNSTEAKPGSPR